MTKETSSNGLHQVILSIGDREVTRVNDPIKKSCLYYNPNAGTFSRINRDTIRCLSRKRIKRGEGSSLILVEKRRYNNRFMRSLMLNILRIHRLLNKIE